MYASNEVSQHSSKPSQQMSLVKMKQRMNNTGSERDKSNTSYNS